jgi:hypothetical protein
MKFIFKTIARKDADQHERQHRHARAGEQPLQPVALKTVAKNFAPAPSRRRRRKARCRIRGTRGWCSRACARPAADAADAAENERDDERAAGEPELDRLRQAGEGIGSVPSATPNAMPMKNG